MTARSVDAKVVHVIQIHKIIPSPEGLLPEFRGISAYWPGGLAPGAGSTAYLDWNETNYFVLIFDPRAEDIFLLEVVKDDVDCFEQSNYVFVRHETNSDLDQDIRMFAVPVMPLHNLFDRFALQRELQH